METAIVAKDDIADPDDAYPAFHMVGDRLRMFDHHIGMGDGAGNENLARRDLDALEYVELVLMARIAYRPTMVALLCFLLALFRALLENERLLGVREP